MKYTTFKDTECIKSFVGSTKEDVVDLLNQYLEENSDILSWQPRGSIVKEPFFLGAQNSFEYRLECQFTKGTDVVRYEDGSAGVFNEVPDAV